MTDLAKLALAFVKECEGDPKAKPINGHDAVQRGGGTLFRYRDLGAVMGAVRAWCDTKKLAFEVWKEPEKPWSVVVCRGVESYFAEDSDPCQALLAACLKAQREIKP